MAMAVKRRSARPLVLLAVGALAALGALQVVGWLPELSNPFRVDRVDRTQPSLLLALEDLSEYRAARGQFQVVVDIEDDTRFVPSFLKGERTTFLAAGTVDAAVDFSGIEEGDVVVAEDGSVTITLPHARLTEPQLDPERSVVLDRDRGVVDRIGGLLSENPTSERELYLLGAERLGEAALESDLQAQAERNTEAMLRSLVEGLGYDPGKVTIRFEDPIEP